MKTDNTTFIPWRYSNSYYACIVILNTVCPKSLSQSSWFFGLGDPIIFHLAVTSFGVQLAPKPSQTATKAVEISSAIFTHNMENILSLITLEGKADKSYVFALTITKAFFP